jgi:hypothetical protein
MFSRMAFLKSLVLNCVRLEETTFLLWLFQVSFNTALTVLLVADGALARQQRVDCPASYENSGHQRSSCQTMPKSSSSIRL